MHETRLIQQIQRSAAFGRFIEIGAGQPIASKLFAVPGASNIVEVAISPYDKDCQDARYPNAKGMRYVCAERVRVMLDSEIEQAHQEKSKANLFLVTSFSLIDEGKFGCSHGYVGIHYATHAGTSSLRRIYHITLPRKNRVAHIDLIGQIGIRLIGLFARTAQYPTIQINVEPFLNYIDGVQDENGNTLQVELIDLFYFHHKAALSHSPKLRHKTSMEHSPKYLEHAVLLNPDGQAERLESFCRRHDQVILFKGSFSILHNMHLAMAETVEKDVKFNSSGKAPQVLFTISINTFDKGNVDIVDLSHRISMIHQAGYPVLLLRYPFFSSNFQYLREREPTKPIIFIAGSDTVERLNSTTLNTEWLDSTDVRFAWFHRENPESNLSDSGSPIPCHGKRRSRFQKYDLTIQVASREILAAIETNDFNALNGKVPDHVAEYHRIKPKYIKRMYIGGHF